MLAAHEMRSFDFGSLSSSKDLCSQPPSNPQRAVSGCAIDGRVGALARKVKQGLCFSKQSQAGLREVKLPMHCL